MATDEIPTLNDEWQKDDITVDGESIRMYTNDDDAYPSVTTITNSRPTPEKDKSIEGWRNWLKGQPDRPDPDEVLDFKGWRGTLAHYKALDPLAPRDLAGEEEIEAYRGLKGWEYRRDDALRQARTDVEWFVESFQDICEDRGIAEFDGPGDDADVIWERVKGVEQYVIDESIGYAGQYDLAYERPDGDTVIADLKTSKADSVSDLLDKKWPDYGMQLAAYARGARIDVDDIEVIWLSPDTKESGVITAADMPRSWDSYDTQFCEHAETFHEQMLTHY